MSFFIFGITAFALVSYYWELWGFLLKGKAVYKKAKCNEMKASPTGCSQSHLFEVFT